MNKFNMTEEDVQAAKTVIRKHLVGILEPMMQSKDHVMEAVARDEATILLNLDYIVRAE